MNHVLSLTQVKQRREKISNETFNDVTALLLGDIKAMTVYFQWYFYFPTLKILHTLNLLVLNISSRTFNKDLNEIENVYRVIMFLHERN